MVLRGRNTVLAVCQRKSDNKILIGFSERNNGGQGKAAESKTWKMPQGGIEDEEPVAALRREILEELAYDLPADISISQLPETVKYHFLEEGTPVFEITLHPFLLRGNFPETFAFDKEEFTQLRWIAPEEIYAIELGIRKDAYIIILKKFALLE